MAASELIVKMRPDAIFDTDKQVLCAWGGGGGGGVTHGVLVELMLNIFLHLRYYYTDTCTYTTGWSILYME